MFKVHEDIKSYIANTILCKLQDNMTTYTLTKTLPKSNTLKHANFLRERKDMVGLNIGIAIERNPGLFVEAQMKLVEKYLPELFGKLFSKKDGKYYNNSDFLVLLLQSSEKEFLDKLMLIYKEAKIIFPCSTSNKYIKLKNSIHNILKETFLAAQQFVSFKINSSVFDGKNESVRREKKQLDYNKKLPFLLRTEVDRIITREKQLRVMTNDSVLHKKSFNVAQQIKSMGIENKDRVNGIALGGSYSNMESRLKNLEEQLKNPEENNNKKFILQAAIRENVLLSEIDKLRNIFENKKIPTEIIYKICVSPDKKIEYSGFEKKFNELEETLLANKENSTDLVKAINEKFKDTGFSFEILFGLDILEKKLKNGECIEVAIDGNIHTNFVKKNDKIGRVLWNSDKREPKYTLITGFNLSNILSGNNKNRASTTTAAASIAKYLSRDETKKVKNNKLREVKNIISTEELYVHRQEVDNVIGFSSVIKDKTKLENLKKNTYFLGDKKSNITTSQRNQEEAKISFSLLTGGKDEIVKRTGAGFSEGIIGFYKIKNNDFLPEKITERKNKNSGHILIKEKH